MPTYADLHGVRTWYDEHGSGERRVLLHPGRADARAFDPNLDALAARFHVLTAERRGHGHPPDVDSPLTDELMATETVAFPEAVVGDRRTCSATANGAIVALIAAPALVDAAVVGAPVRSDAADNFDRWIRDGVVGDEIIAAYGDPADEPDFWRDWSRRTVLDRVTEPVLIRHGTADDTCPLEWSHATLDALQSAGRRRRPDRVRGRTACLRGGVGHLHRADRRLLRHPPGRVDKWPRDCAQPNWIVER